VKFDENAWSSRSQKPLLEVGEETLGVPNVDLQKSENSKSDHQGSKDGVDASILSSSAKKPRWLTQTLQEEEEQVGAPKTSFHLSHPPKKFPNCVALMSSIIDAEPSTYEEATGEKVRQDAMVEEYNSIIKSDVWKIVL